MSASLAKPSPEQKRSPGKRGGPAPTAQLARASRLHPALVLLVLLAGFGLLQCSLPLATAIKIGADEDFAITKAFLSLKGYKLYSEVWNDQPPLHTFLLRLIFQHVSASVLAARLLTVAATLVLLGAVFLLALRVSGPLIAALATVLLIASPGMLELSASAMVELPGLAPAIAALGFLYVGPMTKWRLTEVLAGIVFAVALQIKLIGVLYLPLAVLVLWLRHHAEQVSKSAAWPVSKSAGRGDATRVCGVENPLHSKLGGLPCELMKQCAWSGLTFALAVVIGFLVINHGTAESLSAHLAQARASHFSSAKSYEYGSPADHPFDWSVLLKNWDTTLPAVIGACFLVRRARQSRATLLPLAWLGLTLLVFTTYKPWWTYYYVHNAIPLCWCAAAGIAGVWQVARSGRRRILFAAVVVHAVCAGSWMAGRVYLQAADIRKVPRTYSSLVLDEIERYKPFTEFLFTTEAVYAFHTGIPLPPKLATLSLKRFWTGDMTNAKLVEEMRVVRPGILLLANDTRALPFQNLLHTEYRLVYQDARHRLYVQPKIIEQAEPW